MGNEEEVKVTDEIEQMLTALGSPTSADSKTDKGDGDNEGETEEEKAARLAEEEKSANEAEETESAEAQRLADEEARKNETDEQRTAREEAEATALAEKEKVTLSQLEQERKDREKVEQDAESARLAEEEKKKNANKPLQLEEQDFIGDLDLDDLTHDKTAFNKILNAVYSKGVNDSKRIATEGVLNTIPEIVKHNLTLLTTLKEASDEFYKSNADLVPFKRVVAAVFEEIAAKNPDKKYSELMTLTAPEARKRLELHKEAVKKVSEEEKGKSPRLPGAKGGQRQSQSQRPNTSAIENEISAMNKAIGR
jgi:hypothetical protein